MFNISITVRNQVSIPPIDSMDTDNRVSYPYPLLNGELIYLSLPRKLTKQDAKRIAAFVEGVAIDESGGQ